MILHSANELAEFVKDHRKRKKLSQVDVSDQVGLRQSTVSAFERGPEKAKLETFFKLLSALDLELQLLPKGEPNAAPSGWDEEW